jgi:hypothetical protein
MEPEMGKLGRIIAGLAVVMLSAATASFARQEVNSEDVNLRFQHAVAAYMALHDAVAHAMPSREVTPDAEDIFKAIDALAAGIRAARSLATEGDIFGVDTGHLLRRRLREITREPDCEVAGILATQRDDDDLIWTPRPLVHDQFDWAGGTFMPWCVLRVLPLLPEELQFGFVDRDLVLIDIDADLIVDVLPDALPATESWKGMLHARLRRVEAWSRHQDRRL